MRTRRASAMVFAVVFMILMTGIVLVVLTMANGVRRYGRAAENRLVANAALDGATDLVVSEYATGNLVPPDTRAVTYGTVTCNATVSDNSVSAPDTLKVDLSTSVGGYTYTDSRIVPCKVAVPSVFYFAIATNSRLDSDQRVITGSAGSGGDVYTSGNLDFDGAGSVINGDAEIRGNNTSSSVTITGQETDSATPLTFPTDNPATYLAGATNSLIFGFLPLVVFTPQANGDPRLYYRNGDLSLSGVVSGQGTIYVSGNVTITGNISYANGASKLVLISHGDIIVDSSTSSIVGYFYAGGKFENDRSLTVTGCVVANDVSTQDNLNVTYDPYLWKNIAQGKKLYLPGLWP